MANAVAETCRRRGTVASAGSPWNEHGIGRAEEPTRQETEKLASFKSYRKRLSFISKQLFMHAHAPLDQTPQAGRSAGVWRSSGSETRRHRGGTPFR